MLDFETFFNTWADVAVIFTLSFYTLFTFIYGRFYQWKKRRAGRGVFFTMLTILFVALISFLAIWISEDYWLRPMWRALAWSFAAWAGAYLLYALLRNWNSGEKIEIEPRTGTIPLKETS